MSKLVVKKKNEVFLQIDAEPGIHMELSDYFTFDVPNAKFMPLYRNKMWDGKIRLYSPGTGELYCGLTDHLRERASFKNYQLSFVDYTFYGHVDDKDELIS